MKEAVLNVKPQSSKSSLLKPPQRRKVTLHDHYETWLVNYNEVRQEVNFATSEPIANSLVYRSDENAVGFEFAFIENMVFGSSDPTSDPNDAPIAIQSSDNSTANVTDPNVTTVFELSNTVQLDVSGPTNFSNNLVTFDANSTLQSNGTANFNGTQNFTGPSNVAGTTFTIDSDSQFIANGTSFFNADVEIDANVTHTGNYDLTGDLFVDGYSRFDGNVRIDDDLHIKGNLLVSGTQTTLDITELRIEDKNIVVNKDDVLNNAMDSGLFIQKGSIQDAGFFKVSPTSEEIIQIKAPQGNILNIEIPTRDVTLKLTDDLESDQSLLTTADVSFRSVEIDTSFSRHGNLTSTWHDRDPIANNKGYLSSPWVYTNVIESHDTLDANSTALFMGASQYTYKDEVSFFTQGERRFYINDQGNIGIDTTFPVSNFEINNANDSILTIHSANNSSVVGVHLNDPYNDVDNAGLKIEYQNQSGDSVIENTNQSYYSKMIFKNRNGLILLEDGKTSINQKTVIDGDLITNQEIINDTFRTRNGKLGVNVNVPAYALDVSGNIKTDSDVLLEENDLFLKIGSTQNGLKSLSRSGVAIEDENPLINLSTTKTSYRHGSIVSFIDDQNDRHWSIGTTENGNKLDLGKNFSSTINPEHGLDEYNGETLLRFNENDEVEIYGEANASDAGLKLFSRTTDGINLFVGQKDDVNSTIENVSSFGANKYSSDVRFNGTGDSHGDLSYFPMGGVNGEFGHFRFTRSSGNVLTADPNAKVGAGEFYAATRIGINQETIDSDTLLQSFHTSRNLSRFHTDNLDFKIDMNDSNDTVIINADVGTRTFELKADETNQLSSLKLFSNTNKESELYSNNLRSYFKLQHDTNKQILQESNASNSYQRIQQDTNKLNLSYVESSRSYLNIKNDTDKEILIYSNSGAVSGDQRTLTSGIYSEYGNNKFHLYADDNDDHAILDLETQNNRLMIKVTNTDLAGTDNEGTFIDFGKNDVNDILFLRQVISGSPTIITTVKNNEITNNVNEFNVIGRSSGDAALNVWSTGSANNPRVRLGNPSGATGIRIEYDNSVGDSHIAAINNNNNAHLHFYTKDTDEKFVIGAEGDFVFNGSIGDLDTNESYLFKCRNTTRNKFHYETLLNSDGWIEISNNGTDTSRVRRGFLLEGRGRKEAIYLNTNGTGTGTPTWISDSGALNSSTTISDSNLFLRLSGDDGLRIFSATSDDASISNDLTLASTDEIAFFNKDVVLIKPDVDFIDKFKIGGSTIEVDVPLVHNHTNEFLRYNGGANRWILKDSAGNSGLFYNDIGSGTTYSFTNSMATNTEDVNHQFVFVSGGTSRSSIDLDTGTYRTSGDIIADGDVMAYALSDKKYKDNVEKIKGALDKIEGIRGVEFDWNDQQEKYQGHDVGVIAQEVKEIIPEAVRDNGKELQVNYNKIVPLLIECVKELKQEILELKK